MGAPLNPQSGGSFLPSADATVGGHWAMAQLNLGSVYYSASGPLLPQAHTAVITKATAAVMTLLAPTADRDGDVLIVTSTTAAAHTITATTLLADAVTGSPHTTATFAAFKGATLTLIASNLLWNVQSAVGVVIT